MKVETVEQPTEEQIIEQAAKNEMKLLMDGTEPPVISDAVSDQPKEDDKQLPDASEEDQSKQDDEANQPTEKEQLQAALDRIQKLERALDRTNGTYGNELNRVRNELAEIKSRKQEIAASITPSQFKRIREQFGDDLADALIGDLTETTKAKDGNTADPVNQESERKQIINDPRLDEVTESTGRLAEQVRQMALTELTRIHPDWRKTAAWETESVEGVGNVIRWSDPAFGVWLNKQDSDIRNVVFASDDVNAVSQVLTKYKQETMQTKQPETSTDKTAIQKKLEKTVLPTGRRTGAHELLTEDEVIAKAAQEEQKRIMNGY